VLSLSAISRLGKRLSRCHAVLAVKLALAHTTIQEVDTSAGVRAEVPRPLYGGTQWAKDEPSGRVGLTCPRALIGQGFLHLRPSSRLAQSIDPPVLVALLHTQPD